MDEIALLTTDLARAYAQRTEQTLKRDLRELSEMKILERLVDGRYRAASNQLLSQRAQRSRKCLLEIGDLSSVSGREARSDDGARQIALV